MNLKTYSDAQDKAFIAVLDKYGVKPDDLPKLPFRDDWDQIWEELKAVHRDFPVAVAVDNGRCE